MRTDEPGGLEDVTWSAGGHDLVALEVPLDAGFVGLVRGVAAAVAAAVPELEEERLDDVRLAVSEACTIVGATEGPAPAGGALALRAWRDGAWVRFEVAARGALPPAGATATAAAAEEAERGWGLQLLQALVDDAELRVGSGADVVVALGLRCAPPT